MMRRPVLAAFVVLLAGSAVLAGYGVAAGDVKLFGSSASAEDVEADISLSAPIALEGPSGDVTARVGDEDNGDQRIVFERQGETTFAIVDRHDCAGQSNGMADVEKVDGGFLVKGILASGAAGVSITMPNGSVVDGKIWSNPKVPYPYFEAVVDEYPKQIDTLGVEPPGPCTAPVR